LKYQLAQASAVVAHSRSKKKDTRARARARGGKSQADKRTVPLSF
jgi:hypothetical protein